MTTDQILEKMLSSTYTKTDCYRRLIVLQDMLAYRSYGGNDAQAHAPEAQNHTPVSEEAADAARAWGSEVVSELSGSAMHERLQELRQRVEALPEMMLYVPVQLGFAEVAALGKWCRAHVHPQALIELKVDPASAGGCFLVWKDLFYDFSLPYFMDRHRPALVELLDRYQRTYKNIPG